jgi:DinB superfamily
MGDSMAETPAHLAERLRLEGEKTQEFFRALAPEQWERIIYTDGSIWSIRTLLSHFVATEASITRLMENILGGGPGSPEDFDINRYNERKVSQLKDSTAEELLRRFSELRIASINLVAQMKPEDLSKTGRHPFLGLTNLEEIIKLLYRHLQIHQRDIRRALI